MIGIPRITNSSSLSCRSGEVECYEREAEINLILEKETQELSAALGLENKNQFQDAISKYVSLFAKGTAAGALKVDEQFFSMLTERGGAEHAYLYFYSMVGEAITDAKKVFDNCTLQGDTDVVGALICLGTMYHDGLGVKQSYERALEFFTLAANEGSVIASAKLGKMYAEGYGVSKDEVRARKFYKSAANQGEIFASAAYGMMCLYGMGGKSDEDRARGYLEQAAVGGSRSAQIFLDAMARDDELLKEAAAQEFPGPLLRLGFAFLESKKFDKARECFELTVKRGGTAVLALLGDMHVKIDGKKAIKYYEQLMKDSGDSPVHLLKIGKIYLTGSGGVSQNFEKAYLYFARSFNLGNLSALNYLGMMYINGTGVTRDYVLGLRYLEQAAHGGEAIALNNLGILHFYGHIVERDYDKARNCFEHAAAQGCPDALNRLGTLYFVGGSLGVSQDLAKAYDLFKKAADQGNVQALNNLGDMYSWGKGVERDCSLAEAFYQQARECSTNQAGRIKKLPIAAKSILNMPLNASRWEQIDSLWFV
jgi:uncharacterized protein